MAIEPPSSESAIWTAVGAVLAGAVLKARSWLRTERQADAVSGATETAFKQLRDEIERLAKALNEQHIEIGRERSARREAEEQYFNSQREVHELKSRVVVLEGELRLLRDKVNGVPK